MGDTIRLRHDSACVWCSTPLRQVPSAIYERGAKRTTCLACVNDRARSTTAVGAHEVEANARADAAEATIRLHHAGTSAHCEAALVPGSRARYNRQDKAVRCVTCPADTSIDVGVAGGSARLVGDRQQVKRARPKKGAAGEEAVGRRFAGLEVEGFVVLHDRRKPGKRANVDHIVIGARGIYVIDAKHYSGRLDIRSTGALFRPGTKRVLVKGRERDQLLAAMSWQVSSVAEAAGDLLEGTGAVIRPVLCFLGVEIGRGQQPALVGDDDVLVTWPERFVKDVGRDGPLSPGQIDAVARRVAQALPPAV